MTIDAEIEIESMTDISATDDAAAQTDRLQGELFSQLSLRCHEQNWAQVHAIAEKIASHKRELKQKKDGQHGQYEEVSCVENNASCADGSTDRSGGRVASDGTGFSNSPLTTNSYPNTPRMLSTCLGTASPLAWTCRYSAPSSTVKLVLDLDLSAVRRCLPQLGTPLHEIVGRPRPLRKMPLKQSRWTNIIRNSITSAGVSGDGGVASQGIDRITKKKTKKKKKNLSIPRVLKGLHVWRRTVRALIAADEILLREDAKVVGATVPAAAKAEDADGNNEERCRAIQTMIENVTNINKFEAILGCVSGGATVADNYTSIKTQSSTESQENPPLISSSFDQSHQHESHFFIRATMAQDADGNTPLHFMIRGAAAPALAGVGWQARQDLDDDDDVDSDEEDGGDVDGKSEIRSVGDENSGKEDQSCNLRRNDYWGLEGSSWDGIRWCMEAHLRRVERRGARRIRREMKMADGDDSYSVDRREIELRVASVQIENTVDISHADTDMSDDVEGSKSLKSSVKRKSLEMCTEGVKSSKKKTLSLEPSPQNKMPSLDADNRKRLRSRRKKYFDADEHQDCCYDPHLGAVRDLVYSCPEAVGIPDHREYEETPLIVALKSSIYVLMEPDTDFQVVDRFAGAEGIAAPQQLGGMDGELNGERFGGVPVVAGRDFLFPEMAVLFHNRPMNIFQDDEAMMAVLRGHGRRSTRGNRRSFSTSRSPGMGSENSLVAASDVKCKTSFWQQENSQEKEESEVDCGDDDQSCCSSVSDDPIVDEENDPRFDAFVPGADEEIYSVGMESAGPRLGLLPLRRPRYDYRTALEYRIFCLVRIMLDAYPRAVCLMISDYTPLHSAVFHGRCPDTIRILLEAEARYRSSANNVDSPMLSTSSERVLCPTLPGPALLCTNTRGELPLHFACMSNQCVRSIRLLVGADPRAALVRDASGRAPLRWLWIRFVDGLLDRFGGRDTQGLNEGVNLAFMEQEGTYTSNFPTTENRVTGMSQSRLLSMNDALNGRYCDGEGEDNVCSSMFVFDVGYLSRTRIVDRTVDFLRMRHIPSQFEQIENVAAEHAITVLLKLKYLQQRRTRQLATYGSARSSTSNVILPLDAPMSMKEEFILYAFEKFVALIHAALVASQVEEKHAIMDATCVKQSIVNDAAQVEVLESLSRKKLWHTLPRIVSKKRFFLVHEACRSSRASCPAAVAKICIKLFSDQLFEQDDDGQLPLHKVACRGLGWEPPGSDHDTRCVSLADETLTLLKLVLHASHFDASQTFDKNKQLPLHCAIDSLVTSLTMGKKRRATLHAEARVSLQKYRHTHVKIVMECLTELLRANAQALSQRDGKTGLYPFMQAAIPHCTDNAVVKYTSDLSRRPGLDVGTSFHSIESEVEEENDEEAECDHLSIIYFLLREDPSVIHCC